MATRRPNGAASIYQDKHGYWHGRVIVGVRDDGRPDRRHVGGKTRADVVRRIRVLEKARDSGNVPKADRHRMTVAEWLTHWLENIAAGQVRENTLAGYQVAVNTHLIPGVGAHRLDKLAPEHLERLYKKMINNGSAPATAHQAHRTIRTALNQAVRRGRLTSNPARLATAPRLDDHEIEPYSVEEVRAILAAAAKGRNHSRWAIALALGLRQGEVLGLQWSDLDLDEARLIVRRARQRPRWAHGCAGACGRRHGGYCPQRVPTRAPAAATKSRAGRRIIGLPGALITLLENHRLEQERERAAAAQLWQDGDWVFTDPLGAPLNPNTDYHAWKRLLRSAGVRDGRLHDARHTAATVLLVLGVPDRAVMGIMGWSNSGMTARYQHLTAPIHRDIAMRVDTLLWGTR